jgi:chemotaxis protein histidine kinase CheA
VTSEAEAVVSEAEEAAESVAEEVTSEAEAVASEAEAVVSEAEEAAESVAEEVTSEAEAVASEAEAVVSEAEEAASVAEEAAESVAEEVTSEAEVVASEAEAAENTGVAAPAVMAFADYAAAELDTEVCVETYVQAKQSWWDDKATVYAQDADGAIFIYNMACSEEDYEKLEEGTKIRVTGYKTEWSGEVEITDATFEIVEDADTFVAEPEDVTELLGKDELADYMNKKVCFKGLTVVAQEDADGNEAAFLYNYDGSGTQGDDLYFNVDCNGEEFGFTVESYLTDKDSDVYKAVEGLKIGDVIDAEGFLYWYEGPNPHITSVTVTGQAAESVAEEAATE